MGKIIGQLRNIANTVRDRDIANRQRGQINAEFHVGAWQVTYTKDGRNAASEVTTGNYINPETQGVLYNIHARSSPDIRHVEDDFLKDVIAKFKLIGKSPLYLAPTVSNARVHFWLYYSPCQACLEKIRKFVSGPGYGRNNKNPDVGCWLEMTFDHYYRSWGTAGAGKQSADEAYQSLERDTGGGVVIRQYDETIDAL